MYKSVKGTKQCFFLRGEIQGPEDGVLSSSFNLRHHGHQGGAQDGHQHQEPDSAQHYMAELIGHKHIKPQYNCF